MDIGRASLASDENQCNRQQCAQTHPAQRPCRRHRRIARRTPHESNNGGVWSEATCMNASCKALPMPCSIRRLPEHMHQTRRPRPVFRISQGELITSMWARAYHPRRETERFSLFGLQIIQGRWKHSVRRRRNASEDAPGSLANGRHSLAHWADERPKLRQHAGAASCVGERHAPPSRYTGGHSAQRPCGRARAARQTPKPHLATPLSLFSLDPPPHPPLNYALSYVLCKCCAMYSYCMV